MHQQRHLLTKMRAQDLEDAAIYRIIHEQNPDFGNDLDRRELVKVAAQVLGLVAFVAFMSFLPEIAAVWMRR